MINRTMDPKVDQSPNKKNLLNIAIVLVISVLVVFSTLEYYNSNLRSEEINQLKLKINNSGNFSEKAFLHGNNISSNFYQYEGNNLHQFVINSTPGNFSIKLNGSIIVDPSYSDGMFFVPITNMMECTGALYAVNSTNGKIVWNDSYPNEVMTEPLIVNDLAIVGLGNNQFVNPNVRGTGINFISAVNIFNGSSVWEFNTCGEDMPTPVYHNGLIIEPSGSGIVYAINASNGKQVWNLSTGSFVSMSSPAIYDGNIYFGGACPYAFYAVNITRGNIVWTYYTNATGGLTDGSPVILNGQVFDGYTVDTGDNVFNDYIFSLNASNGNLNWLTYEGTGIQPNSPPIEIPPLTASGNTVFSEPTSLGKLYAINAETGNIEWSAVTGTDDSNPAIINGIVLTVNITGTLYVINSTGCVVNSYKTGVVFGPGNIIVMVHHLILFGNNGVMESIPFTSIKQIII